MKFFDSKISLGLALGESWLLLAQPQKNTDVHKGIILWESFPNRTCKDRLRWEQGCKLIDQIYTTILLRQPREELVPWERTPGHWSKHLKFRPSWLFHKGCLSLHSWQTAMLAHVGTLNSAYWALSTFQSAFIWAISFSGSMKFFQLKISLGLALGESWLLLCANVQCLSLRYFAGRLSRGFTGFWHLMTDEITNQTLEVLTDARMLAVSTQRTGPSNTLQSAFIWAISFSCWLYKLYAWSSFNWKRPLGWPWANLGRCLPNHRKTLMSTMGRLSQTNLNKSHSAKTRM